MLLDEYHYLLKRISELIRRFRQVKERLLAIPAVRLLALVAYGLGAHDASHMAAGVAYYGFISIFPLLLGIIALLGIFLKSEAFQESLINFFATYLPGSTDILQQNIESVIRLRGTLGVISVLFLIWSGSTMFGAIRRAVNRAWGIHKSRPFYIAKALDLAMAFSVATLFLLSLGGTTLLQIVGQADIPFVGNPAINAGALLLALVFSFLIFLLIYKLLPLTRTRWRYTWPGALLATILFEVAKNGFLFYLGRFANYEAVYGSLGSIIVLLLWIYISAFILIFGAEFTFQYTCSRERETPEICEEVKGWKV